MAQSPIRAGRVSKINYDTGMLEIAYIDREGSVTEEVPMISNGEYRMPAIGQMVNVSHNSNGQAMATVQGTVWNKTNKPIGGKKGLYRKEYSNTSGKAYENYDDESGSYTQYTDKKTSRNTNGEIYDEAKGSISMVAKDQVMLKSTDSSVGISGEKGVGINSEDEVSIEAESYISLHSKGTVQVETTGDYSEDISGNRIEEIEGTETITVTGERKVIAKSAQEIQAKTLTIKVGGATVTISETGEIVINAEKVTVISNGATLQANGDINITATGGDVKIMNVSFMHHKHEGGTGEPING